MGTVLRFNGICINIILRESRDFDWKTFFEEEEGLKPGGLPVYDLQWRIQGMLGVVTELETVLWKSFWLQRSRLSKWYDLCFWLTNVHISTCGTIWNHAQLYKKFKKISASLEFDAVVSGITAAFIKSPGFPTNPVYTLDSASVVLLARLACTLKKVWLYAHSQFAVSRYYTARVKLIIWHSYTLIGQDNHVFILVNCLVYSQKWDSKGTRLGSSSSWL